MEIEAEGQGHEGSVSSGLFPHNLINSQTMICPLSRMSTVEIQHHLPRASKLRVTWFYSVVPKWQKHPVPPFWHHTLKTFRSQYQATLHSRKKGKPTPDMIKGIKVLSLF
jgi:hypothetical protein